MTPKRMMALAARLLDDLPPLPQPWDVEVFCREIGECRSRTLTLHPVDFEGFPSAMWYGNAVEDHIFYRSSYRGAHRDHVILHEICHMIVGHGARTRRSLRSGGCGHSRAQEQLAEAFASTVLERCSRPSAAAESHFERRASELFGA